ncbi:cytochrome aa3 quinol oxidase subunit II [Cytobacillus sp. Hz8]|uniref:cytochrome aa3 quinol oxidase subunit II n=1 Tax=Cytobacillus sp. Hz8 TaxID=3347168 RepID=UPI0035DFAE0C
MKSKLTLISLLACSSILFLSGCESKLVVFDPQGPAAKSILDLINWSLIFMVIVVIVVFGLFGYIVWKYREKDDNKDYEPPEEHGNKKLEFIWTAIPIIIVIALTIPTVKTIYNLEKVPKGYEDKKPITIHVTSADWKWIFSYPDQGIETVNYINIPEDTPVHFKLTSASTMQSFWIPALGGQKYTMNKMETQMYLVADNPGSYLGRNTNFNGRGYADMEFEVQAQTKKDFDKWVKEVKQTAPKLTESKYNELLKPTHLGRETFVNTHLQWVNHADMNSKTYTNPELYKTHGYQGKIFDDEKAENQEKTTDHNMDGMNMDMDESKDGGEHHEH